MTSKEKKTLLDSLSNELKNQEKQLDVATTPQERAAIDEVITQILNEIFLVRETPTKD